MTITPEQIDLWRSAASETQNLEFKEANQQYDTRRLCKYCVAIANEGGGHLVLGIADKAPRQIVGSQAFLDTQDIAEKLFQWLGFRVDVEAVRIGEQEESRVHFWVCFERFHTADHARMLAKTSRS